jgi:hypothetical protein
MGRGNQPEEKDRESMRRGSTDDILEPDRGHSDLVNEAVNLTVAEDADDLAAFKERVTEPDPLFESVAGT